MDPDLLLVIGIIIGFLAIPSLLTAYTESRAPRAGAVMVLIAGVLIALAVNNKAIGYEISEVPGVFKQVFLRYLN